LNDIQFEFLKVFDNGLKLNGLGLLSIVEMIGLSKNVKNF